MPLISTSRLTTLDHYINQEEDLHPEATGEFTSLLHQLTFAIRIISRDVRRAGLNDILGLTKQENVHGEQVRKLDQYSNEVIKISMQKSGLLCCLASEEEQELVTVKDESQTGKYVLVYDPLDGSSNIDVNITIGTIFSLYKRLDPSLRTPGTVNDVLQPGYKQEAAGYVLYGSSTILAYTTGHGVNMFTYDPTLGEFLLTFENVKIPKKGNYYSVNESYYHYWDKGFRKYIDYIKTPGDNDRPYIHRYIGTGVADIHRTLHYGGIYCYPQDDKHPQGKFRLVYEANPLAFLIEQAGGRATTGTERILTVQPQDIHQKTPLVIGSEDDVKMAEEFIQGKRE